MSKQMPYKSLSGICVLRAFAKFMQPKILSKRILLVVASLGFIFFVVNLLNFLQKNLTQDSSTLLLENVATLSKQEQRRSELPVRLKIPSINVDAPVEYVGLTSDGAMDVPKERANVAWFNLGSRPGENGSAVVAGHYGWKNGKTSAFDNLYKLRKGDKIYIEDENGTTITFVVRESRRYDPKADASYVFGSYDGKSHLNLITCEGAWDKVFKTYSKRLVVFTDKE